jgi:hypothetical protein
MFDRKPPEPKLLHGLDPLSGTLSPYGLSKKRSAPAWQMFVNLCQTGVGRPGIGRPPSGPSCCAYSGVIVETLGFSRSRHGEVNAGAPSLFGCQVTCGSPTPPVMSRFLSGTYTRSVNTPVGFFDGSTYSTFGPGLKS